MPIEYSASLPTAGESHVLPPGNYGFRVIEAEEETSKSGNPMIKLKLRLIKGGKDGSACFDRLVFTPAAHWKIDQFLSSCARNPGPGATVMLDPNDMIGWSGEVKIKQAPDLNGTMRNEVDRYLFEDQIPF